MEVKNLFVSNKKSTMEIIERLLCKMGISYVKIENEIHCPGLILRFFSFKSYRKGTLSPNEMRYLENSPSMEILEIRGRRTKNSDFKYFSTFEGTKEEKIKRIKCTIVK